MKILSTHKIDIKKHKIPKESLKNKTIISWKISGELDFYLKFKVLIEGGKQRMFKN